MSIWTENFDHIYCLNFLPNIEKRQYISNEFERVGIDVNANYFSWKETIDSPFYDQLLDSSTFIKEENNRWWQWKTIKSIIRCSLGHYSIWKDAQYHNYKHILIFEDDIIFLNNIIDIYEALQNNPKDYDIILYDKFICIGIRYYNNIINNYSYNNYFAKYGIYNEYLASCGYYALSNRYIDYLIKKQEEKFCPADHYINNLEKDEYKRYFAIKNLGIQKEYSSDKNYFEDCYKKLGLKKEWYNY